MYTGIKPITSTYLVQITNDCVYYVEASRCTVDTEHGVMQLCLNMYEDIANVKISPNPVKTGESFKIAVKIIELTEDSIRLPYRLGRNASSGPKV